MEIGCVACGAAGGALLRWKISESAAQHGLSLWSTAAINISGSFLLGAVASQQFKIPKKTRLFLGTGFCGAFTTFSTFSVETIGLLNQGRIGAALVYVAGSNVFSIGAALLAFKLFRRIPPSATTKN